METPARVNSLQTYQVIVYDRALHPEFFDLKSRRVEKRNGFEFEAWLMSGSHVLRFELGRDCASELVTDLDLWNQPVPVERFLAQLSQRYALRTILAATAEEGFQVSEQAQQQDGSIELVVTRWA